MKIYTVDRGQNIQNGVLKACATLVAAGVLLAAGCGRSREGITLAGSTAFQPFSGIRKRSRLDEIVERSLKGSSLWDEVKDRLQMSGLRLSGGQQQRLCLARVLAMEELEVILLDEPCSGLDPISTAKIEDALKILKEKYTIILVTNNTKQAARVADDTAFFLMGEMVEYGTTDKIFTAPNDKRTNDYVTGRFG